MMRRVMPRAQVIQLLQLQRCRTLLLMTPILRVHGTAGEKVGIGVPGKEMEIVLDLMDLNQVGI